jgi:hypothetical protein
MLYAIAMLLLTFILGLAAVLSVIVIGFIAAASALGIMFLFFLLLFSFI